MISFRVSRAQARAAVRLLALIASGVSVEDATASTPAMEGAAQNVEAAAPESALANSNEPANSSENAPAHPSEKNAPTVVTANAEPQQLPLDAVAAALAPDAQLQLFTITDQPGLHIMQAASLAQQGAMFARVVALLERRDMPRHRVASETAIEAHARRFGTDPAGLTAGNNFSAVELAYFFELAREEHVELSDGERALKSILVQWHLIERNGDEWRAVGPRDFLLTIPAPGPAPRPAPAGETIDVTVRAAILSHELGHWQFFSDSNYAHACRTFWWQALSFDERAEITRQLADLGYDPSDRIIVDEMQAYLLHTPAADMPLADTAGPGGIDVAKIRLRMQKWLAGEDGAK